MVGEYLQKGLEKESLKFGVGQIKKVDEENLLH